MQDNFFDDERNYGGQTGGQRVPAPTVAFEKPKKKKARWWHIVLAVCIGLVTFFAGYLVCWASLDPEMRTLIGVKKRIQSDYYKEITDEEFYDVIFDGINDVLLDDYSGYMNPDEFAASRADLKGNRIGVGLVFQGLRVVRVCGGSPAEAAGIVVGEKVTACGDSEENLTPCKTFQEFSDFLAPYGEGQEFFVQLTLEDDVRVVKLYKSTYVENYVFYRTNSHSYTYIGENSVQTARNDPLTCLADDTAYIRLVQFTGNAAVDFDEAMAQFKADGKKNLVLDLRGNGGGLVDMMQSIAGYFCKNSTESKPIVAIADYGEKRTAFAAKGNYYNDYFSADSRICVLADIGSASASECLIGSMVDYGAIGYDDICLVEREGVAKTYGKGIMQETHVLSYIRQDAIKLTTATIHWPLSYHCIHDRGVLPEDGAQTVAEDYVFERETVAAIEKLFG